MILLEGKRYPKKIKVPVYLELHVQLILLPHEVGVSVAHVTPNKQVPLFFLDNASLPIKSPLSIFTKKPKPASKGVIVVSISVKFPNIPPSILLIVIAREDDSSIP